MIFSIKPQIFELKCVFSYFRLKTHITLLLPVYVHSWEQRKLGELTSLITKGTTPLDKSNIGTVNFVKIESIDNSSGEITITQKISSEEHEGYLRRSQLKENDILFSIAGTLGRVTSVKSSILPANTNQALAIIRLKSGCLKYVKTYLKGKAVADFIKKNPTIGAQPNLSLEQVSNLDIALPSEIEQEQIGAFFEQLDNLITLHQCKCQIDGCRFQSPLAITWEQRKLGDVVQITMGQSPDGSTYSDEPSDYILVQGNADLQNGWVCPRIWTTQITKKADAGDLIMSVRAPAGAMGKTAYNAVIGRGVAAIKGNEFIYQLLVKMDADGFWKILSCGSTFESLNSENIKNAEVKIPTTAEQIKIGGYFQQLDNLITLHQCE